MSSLNNDSVLQAIDSLNLPKTDLTSEQAKQVLALLVNNEQVTADSLRDLVNRVSTVGTGEITLLFSGGDEMNGASRSHVIVSEIARQTSNIRTIDSTEVAKFFTEDSFKEAIEKTLGGKIIDPSSGAYKFFTGTDGLWGDISANFVRDAKGIVTGVIMDPDPTRTFAVREIPELLANKNITSAFGLPLDELSKMDGLSNQQAFDLFTQQSKFLMEASNLRLIQGEVRQASAFLEISQDMAGYLGRNSEAIERTVDYMSHLPEDVRTNISSIANELELQNTSGVDGGKILSRLGKGIFVLGFLLASSEAKGAEEAGDHEKAKEIMRDWALESSTGFVGGEIGAAIGGIAVGALAAAGITLSAPVSGAIILGAALTGGIYGADGAKQFQEYLDKQDAEAKKILFDKITELLYNSKDFTIAEKTSALLSGNFYSLASDFTLKNIIEQSQHSLAWRYALKHENPFVIENMDYSRFNQNGELELQSTQYPDGMTQAFIQAKAEMLMWMVQYIKNGIDLHDRFNISNGIFPAPVDGDHTYQDIDSGLKLDIDGTNPTTFASHYHIFGGENNDTITGDKLSDTLFGGAGNDTIEAGKGSDYLEGNQGNDTLIGGSGNDRLIGGTGFDTYVIEDFDTIYDVDGQGTLQIEGIDNIPTLQLISANRWNQKLKMPPTLPARAAMTYF